LRAGTASAVLASIAIAVGDFMPISSRFVGWVLLAAAAAVLAVSQALGAPRDEGKPDKPRKQKLEDVMVPIPGYSPPVTDNGCPVRSSPADKPAAKPGHRAIPYWELVSNAFGRYAIELTIGRNLGRDVFLRKIAEAGLSPDARIAATLYALGDNMGRDGLHTHFFMSGGALAPEIRDALQAAGLTREHEIYAKAIAAFGPHYPLDNDVRSKLFGYHEAPELNAFDRKLLAIVKAFPDEKALGRKIETFIESRPELWREIEARRKTLGKERRLGILSRLLWAEAASSGIGEISAATLPQFTPEERTLLAVDLFNMEFENGGIHQFFYNSSGDFAPDVLAALETMQLTRQAELFRKAMALFKAPYPRNRDLRHKSYIGKKNDEGFESQLSDMTDDFYAIGGGPVVTHLGTSTQIEGGPGIRDGMLRFADEHGLLPC
jgi:hypothetical protein